MIATKATLLFVFLAALGVLGGYAVNNAESPPPTTAQLRQSRDRAIDWIKAHEASVLEAENPALWWMIRDSAVHSGDAYLSGLYRRYYERYLARNPNNIWHHLFDENATLRIPIADLSHFPDYNLLFLYGLSCQSTLGANPLVKAQMQPDFCASLGTVGYFRDPSCITHQFMGTRFMQQRHCEDSADTSSRIAELQERIARHAAWDFRVVDFYLQRVLLLAESRADNRIHANWLHRILNAQLPDGGWDDFDPIISLGSESLGWGGRGLRIRQADSNFHTTAQGLYLMSLLNRPTSDAVEQ